MLDDGKAQPGAAHLAGAALIHPVEPLKNAALMFGSDADARIADDKARPVTQGADLYLYRAAFSVVLNGVIHQVDHHPPDTAGRGLNGCLPIKGEREGNLAALCLAAQ